MGMIPHHDAYIFINDELVVLLYLVLIFFCEIVFKTRRKFRSKSLNGHSKQLNGHSKQLNGHSKLLNGHSMSLNEAFY